MITKSAQPSAREEIRDMPDIRLHRFKEGKWGVRIGSGALPEIFSTPQEALDAALDKLGLAPPPPPTPDTTAAELLGLVGEWERRTRGFRTTEFGQGKKEGIEECVEDLRTLACTRAG